MSKQMGETTVTHWGGPWDKRIYWIKQMFGRQFGEAPPSFSTPYVKDSSGLIDEDFMNVTDPEPSCSGAVFSPISSCSLSNSVPTQNPCDYQGKLFKNTLTKQMNH